VCYDYFWDQAHVHWHFFFDSWTLEVYGDACMDIELYRFVWSEGDCYYIHAFKSYTKPILYRVTSESKYNATYSSRLLPADPSQPYYLSPVPFRQQVCDFAMDTLQSYLKRYVALVVLGIPASATREQ